MFIRSANASDAETITALIQELAHTMGDESPLKPAYVLQVLSSPGMFVLLAEEGGKVLGLLSCSVHPDLFHGTLCGTIGELVVTAGARNRGVGAALMEEVLRRAESEGWAEVSLSTMEENTGAQRFYERMGFTDRAVLLEKHLD